MRGMGRSRRSRMHRLGVLPIRARDDERVRGGKIVRQPRISLYQPHVVLARMLYARNVEDRGGRAGVPARRKRGA